jgi:hypothetical protein
VDELTAAIKRQRGRNVALQIERQGQQIYLPIRKE